jgi:hemerythrin-like domain-containing protein
LETVVEELIEEHGVLRALFARAMHRTLDTAGLKAFVATLSQHIRKEERQLFEGLQRRLGPEQMASSGKACSKLWATLRMLASCRMKLHAFVQNPDFPG